MSHLCTHEPENRGQFPAPGWICALTEKLFICKIRCNFLWTQMMSSKYVDKNLKSLIYLPIPWLWCWGQLFSCNSETRSVSFFVNIPVAAASRAPAAPCRPLLPTPFRHTCEPRGLGAVFCFAPAAVPANTCSRQPQFPPNMRRRELAWPWTTAAEERLFSTHEVRGSTVWPDLPWVLSAFDCIHRRAAVTSPLTHCSAI